MSTPHVTLTNRASRLSRAAALALALVLVVACAPDIAHALGGDRDGCALARSDSSRPPVAFVDLAALPVSGFWTGGPMLAQERVPDRPSLRTVPALAEPRAPRAPPLL